MLRTGKGKIRELRTRIRIISVCQNLNPNSYLMKFAIDSNPSANDSNQYSQIYGIYYACVRDY